MATSDQEEIARLRAVNAELEYDLTEAQDQLLSLTEKDNDVPEKEVKDAYLAIIRGVNFWIDEVSGHKDFNFKPKWQQHLRSGNRREALRDLGLDARCHDITWQKTLGEKPSAHYTFLSLVIVSVLKHNIFDRSSTSSRGVIYPFGSSGKFIKLVEELQQAMGSEELRRDESQILRWRGETISAMYAQRLSRKQTQQAVDEILEVLTKELEDWLDYRVLEDRKKSLQQYVIDPAIEFARLAGCAHKKYILEDANFIPGPVPDRCSWNIRDASNWRQITPSEARGVFHCLWPKLVRKGIGSQPDNQLVQPIMIGYLAAHLEVPELSQPGTSRESVKSSRTRGDDAARSKQSASPPRKSSPAKRGRGPSHKEPWSKQNPLPGNWDSSSSPSRDTHPGRHLSESKNSTWPIDKPSTRRRSTESTEGVIGAYSTEEWHVESDDDDRPYRQTAEKQF